MAVSAFLNDDRHREGSDVDRDSHKPHPLSGGVTNRLRMRGALGRKYKARDEKCQASVLDKSRGAGIIQGKGATANG